MNTAINTIEQSSIYDVVAGMLQQAVPLKKNKKTFGPDTLLDDIGMDSLEVLSVAMDLEEHYDLFIPDEDINAFARVGDIAAYLEQALASKLAQAESAQAEQPDIIDGAIAASTQETLKEGTTND